MEGFTSGVLVAAGIAWVVVGIAMLTWMLRRAERSPELARLFAAVAGDASQPVEAMGQAPSERLQTQSSGAMDPTGRRIEELEQQVKELSTLNQVIRSVDYRLSLQDILNDALSQTVSGLNLAAGAIFLRSGEQMLLSSVEGIPTDLQPTMERLTGEQVGHLLQRRILHPGADEQVLTDDLLSFLQPAYEKGFRSWLALELSTRELRAGLFLIAAAGQERFGEHEIEMLSSIADQISIAIENASLFQETLRSLRRLEAMNRASQMVSASVDLERAQVAVAQSACELANADAAGLYEWDKDTDALSVRVGYRLRHEFIEAMQFITQVTGLTEDAVGQAANTQRPVEVADIQAIEGHPFAEAYLAEGYRSLLAVPMLKGEEVIGGICVWWRKPQRASLDVISLLTTLANQSVSAIENARLSTFNEQIIHCMDEGILIEDAEGIISFANPRVAEMLGYERPEDLINQRVLSWIDTSDRFVARQQHNAVLAGERRRYEAKFQAKTGHTIPVLASSAPLAGRVISSGQILTVLTDLSEIKQLQERLLQTEKLSALGELVAGVAHELNNPLTSIIGYARLIQAHGVSEVAREDLDRILRQAQRAGDIVRNLLAFARQETPRRQSVDLNELIQRTLALRSYELRVQNVHLETCLDDRLPATMADPMQCQQVFLNLMLNAEQAMAEAGVGSKIIIRSWRDGESIELEISDDGPGIPGELLGRIFDPFVTTKQQGKGTGLGLSICYGIVREHGGRIWAESAGVPGKGARFRISLPVVAGDTTRGNGTLELTDKEKDTPAELCKARILLVDDEEDILEMVARVLSECGYTVDSVRNGLEAIDRIRRSKRRYDLILSDIKMPEMSGFELYTRVAERYPGLRQRVVFITGDVAGEQTASFLRRTGIPALRKPFEVDELISFVQTALHEREQSFPSNR